MSFHSDLQDTWHKAVLYSLLDFGSAGPRAQHTQGDNNKKK